MKHKEKPFDLMAAIEEGQCFTRDGRNVVLVCVCCDGGTYPVRGVISVDGVMLQADWTLDGRFLTVVSNHHNDLMNEISDLDDED